MTNGLPFLRKKSAKGSDYYYFDAGKGDDGRRILTPLPHIKDPRFGDCYTRAKAERSKKKNQQGVLTLDGLIRDYERAPEYRNLSLASKRNYAIYLAKANKLIRSGAGESPPVKRIDKDDMLALRDRLADTPGAANQAIRAMSALFAWAVKANRLKDNPAAGITLFKATPHDPWPEDLLEVALADPQVGMPVALLYFTGQRINDAIRMSWRDIQDDYMRVYVQKKDKHIKVAILPELQEMLDRQEKTAVTILTNANGSSWSQGGLRQKLQEWAKEHGHRVVPHGLRKNAVISLLEAGCTAAEVSGITDQTIQMIEHYAEKVNKLTLGRAAMLKFGASRTARNKSGK